MGIYIRMLGKGVQRAIREKLNGKGDFLRFWLVLLQQLLTEVLQGRRRSHIVALLIVPIHRSGTAVNDRFLLCAKTAAADELFAKGQNKLRFQDNGVCAVTVIGVHIHSVDMVFARCRDVNDLALHCLYKRRILSLWVNNDNIGVGVGQNDVRHFFLCRKGFACTRHAEDKGITVEQVAAVSDNHILADYILPVINAVLVIDFLHPKRNKHRKTFRCKGAQGVNLSHTERQHRI